MRFHVAKAVTKLKIPWACRFGQHDLKQEDIPAVRKDGKLATLNVIWCTKCPYWENQYDR